MTANAPPDDAFLSKEAITIPVIEEFIKVEKRTIDQGGYRLTRDVETRQETVDELLRSHKVTIERRPIGTQLPVSDMPQPHYEGETLVIPVFEEILVTEKRLVLIEEVRITPVETTHRQQQSVDLRKETISIERLAVQDDPGLPQYRQTDRQGITPRGQIRRFIMSSTLVGMFDNQADAERARIDLVSAGFPASAISMTGGGVASTARYRLPWRNLLCFSRARRDNQPLAE